MSWRGDNLGQWVAYTPTITASTTNPGLGAGGAIAGAYATLNGGKTVVWRVRIDSGTSPTAGSGTYRISLPVAPAASAVGLGTVFITDAITTGAVTYDGTGANMYGTNPNAIVGSAAYNLATGRSYILFGTYEAA